jgi:hypothetical protein
MAAPRDPLSVRPTVVATAAPSAESGYVAGVFSRTGRDRFGLGIVDAAGQEFVMPFGDSSQEETAQGRLAIRRPAAAPSRPGVPAVKVRPPVGFHAARRTPSRSCERCAAGTRNARAASTRLP